METDIKKCSRMMGLLVACPFIDRLNSCPMNFMQKVDMHDRYLWMINLDSEQVDNYLTCHDICFAERHKDFMAALYNKKPGGNHE